MISGKRKSQQIEDTASEKQPKSDSKIYPKLDQYEASNYHLKLTDEQKMIAEHDLLKEENLVDLKALSMKTRGLQRDLFESLSVKSQLEKFPWLKEVKASMKIK